MRPLAGSSNTHFAKKEKEAIASSYDDIPIKKCTLVVPAKKYGAVFPHTHVPQPTIDVKGIQIVFDCCAHAEKPHEA